MAAGEKDVRGRGDASGLRGREAPARRLCGAETTPVGAERPASHQRTRLIDSQSGIILAPSGRASSEPRRGTP